MAKKSKDYQQMWIESGIDLPGRHIFINDDIGEEMADRLISGLHLMDGDKPVTITLQTYGGDVDSMFAMYDAIKGFHAEIVMKVSGYACSAGMIILQAADSRLIAPHAYAMHHVGEGSLGHQHPRNLEHAHNLYKRQMKMMETILLTKIKEKHPDMTEAKFRNRHDWDIFLSAQETVDMGLADAISY